MDRIASGVVVDGVEGEKPGVNPASTREGSTQFSKSQEGEKNKRQRTMPMEREPMPLATRAVQPPIVSTSPRSSRPNSSRRASSRRSSTAQTSSRSSNTCSRRSSFLIREPSENPTQRARVPQRSNSAAHYRTFSTDSPAFHSQSVSLFQPLKDSMANVEQLPPRQYAHLTSASLPALRFPATVDACTSQSSSTLVESSELPQQSYSNHVPATTIDWTLPSTRRRQYNEIEKSSRGFRGLIRLVTPSLFWLTEKRVGFYDAEKGSDAGTTRRYRLDPGDDDSIVSDEGGEKYQDMIEVTELGGRQRREGQGTRHRWNCFRFGKMQREELSEVNILW